MLQPLAKRTQVLVPEGLARIAQRFNVGNRRPTRNKPEGTADPLAYLQPSLRDFYPLTVKVPTLKRWAIIGHPSGMMRGKSEWHWTESAPMPQCSRGLSGPRSWAGALPLCDQCRT